MSRLSHRLFACRGFSVMELVVAVAVTLAIAATVFTLIDSASGAFQVQPETADAEQRLRAAVEALTRDVQSAGAGVWVGPLAGAFGRVVPAVLPYRVGRRNPDPPGTFRSDRLTVLYVPSGSAQTTLASPMAAADGAAVVAPGPACPAGDAACGLEAGSLVVVFDSTGAWDLFSVTSVSGSTIAVQHNGPTSSKVYVAGEATIAEVVSRTYFVREAPGTGTPQLTQYDGAGGADVPVVSHVVSIGLEYFGEADPPGVAASSGDESLRTTYGPAPPAPWEQPTAYPPGENCAFARSPSGGVVARLPALAVGPVLVPLSASELTDGPWCPDEWSPGRYDADLLRVRAVALRVRVQAAVESLRGAAGPSFAHGGTSRGSRVVPDREVTVVITPRPLGQVR